MSNAKKERQDANVRWLGAIKLDRGCEICGYNEHPYALQFDHLEPSEKNFNIATWRSCSRETLQKEIDKCRVLCANCHSIHSKDPEYFKKDTKQLESTI